ncbi:MAG: hypothetical protein EOM67_12300 [Spirochaetia bacterium]|nr:hypothetical protein [Spirochaetia bacterium]
MKYPVYVLRDLIANEYVLRYERVLYKEHSLTGLNVFELIFKHEGKYFRLIHKRSKGYTETLEQYNAHELIECQEVEMIARTTYEYVAKDDILG